MSAALTDRQADYILALLDEREVDPAAAPLIRKRVTERDITKALASDWITRLQAKPRKHDAIEGAFPHGRVSGTWEAFDVRTFEQMGQPSERGEEMFAMVRKDPNENDLIVPRGSYAVDTESGATNEVAFYSVWIRDDGERWSVKLYVSDRLEKLSRAAQYTVLDKISADPAKAAERYGLEIGKCGICHRKLTNDESRARGIGPICAQKWGW